MLSFLSPAGSETTHLQSVRTKPWKCFTGFYDCSLISFHFIRAFILVINSNLKEVVQFGRIFNRIYINIPFCSSGSAEEASLMRLNLSVLSKTCLLEVSSNVDIQCEVISPRCKCVLRNERCKQH